MSHFDPMFPSLFFTVDKKHATDLSDTLRGNGIRVYPLSEETPTGERRRLIASFKAGDLDGLSSCGVLNEGADLPWAVGGFLCRPTKSEPLYRQMVGRILRPNPAPIGQRQYQIDALRAIWRHLQQGIMNQLIVLPTGCHQMGQQILMFDGRTKAVEEVRVGDKLMGPDSLPRTVLQLCRGTGNMVRIRPAKGQPFIVNEDHVLTLVKTCTSKSKFNRSGSPYPCHAGGLVEDISVKEYASQSKTFRHVRKLFSVPIEFQEQPAGCLPIPSYILGILLGDGCIRDSSVGICSIDPEIVSEFKAYAEFEGMSLKVSDSGGTRAPTYSATSVRERRYNPILYSLEEIGLTGAKSWNKFIPHSYKTASRWDRLELLAGLMDTDGSLDKSSAGYDYISKSENLADDVCFLARSLGLSAYVKPSIKHCQTGGGGKYYRVSISGEVDSIPCRIPRKKASKRRQKKDSLRRGFDVEPIGPGEYFGFTLDGDGRYLLDDFTVTHNTGKTRIATQTTRVIDHWKKTNKRGRILFLVHRDQLAGQAADAFAEHTSLTVGVEMGSSYASDSQVVVGSVQTLGTRAAWVDDGDGEGDWRYNARLQSFNPDHFDCVIVDESHHSVLPGAYHHVLRHFHALKGESERDPEILLLLLTATPNRADNIGMESVADAISFEYSLREATKEGYLADLHPYRCETTIDLSALRSRGEDLPLEKLSRMVNIPERNELVAREYLRVRDMIAPDFLSNVGRKPYAVLVDFVDIAGKHPLISAASLYGLRDQFDAKGASLREQVEHMEAMEAEQPGLDLHEAVDLEDAKRRAESFKTSLHKLDLMNPALPAEMRGMSKFGWLSEGESSFRLCLMDSGMLTIRMDALGRYEINRHVKGIRTKLAAAGTLAEAVKLAEKEIPSGEKRVLAVDAAWREDPPSEAQARRLSVVDKELNRSFRGNPFRVYEYIKARFDAGDTKYSKGGISDRLNRLDAARS